MRIIILSLLLLGIWGCGGEPIEQPTSSGLLVTTEYGQLRGMSSPYNAGIRVFRGIPYAKAPVGDLRWTAPKPVEAWDGTRLADTFSASCFQQRHKWNYVWRMEDFQVSRIASISMCGRHHRPSLYRLWSGSMAVLIRGQGNSLIFDGTALAARDVMVVTVNYRLGAFGFLAHPWFADVSDSGHAGNYGLMDKIAALEWVRDNASAFGGILATSLFSDSQPDLPALLAYGVA